MRGDLESVLWPGEGTGGRGETPFPPSYPSCASENSIPALLPLLCLRKPHSRPPTPPVPQKTPFPPFYPSCASENLIPALLPLLCLRKLHSRPPTPPVPQKTSFLPSYPCCAPQIKVPTSYPSKASFTICCCKEMIIKRYIVINIANMQCKMLCMNFT